MKLAICLVVVACGRSGFDTPGDARDAGSGSGSADGPAGPRPVMWFPLDEATGSTSFADIISGHPGNCSGTSCPTSVAGHHGTAVNFDGVNDCIIVPDAGQASPPAVTVAVWLNEPAAIKATLFAKRTSVTAGDVWQLELGLDQHVQLTFVANAVEYSAASVPGALTAGAWHHLAGTYDGATAKVYLDGALAGTHVIAGTLSYDMNAVTIGCEGATTFAEFFAGALDDVQLYDRALTAAEIATLAAN